MKARIECRGSLAINAHANATNICKITFSGFKLNAKQIAEANANENAKLYAKLNVRILNSMKQKMQQLMQI